MIFLLLTLFFKQTAWVGQQTGAPQGRTCLSSPRPCPSTGQPVLVLKVDLSLTWSVLSSGICWYENSQADSQWQLTFGSPDHWELCPSSP